jgi:hypothetical protein
MQNYNELARKTSKNFQEHHNLLNGFETQKVLKGTR